MLNHNQTAIVLVIGLVAVLMTSASTRVFAQPTLPPNEENKVNNALHADEQAIADKIAADKAENKIAAAIHDNQIPDIQEHRIH
jgi:hypothetical protein